MQASEQATLVAAIVEIARQAGDLILDIYHSDFEVRGKEDASPVTAADEQAEALILQGLNTLATPYPIIAEEAYAAGDIPAVDDCFWLVDPLDGTRTAALDELLKGRTVHSLINAGSSLKLCLIAAGQADVYPRQGRTMEWDIAAGDAVLRAAGGHVQVFDGSPLRYGKAGFENPHFVASGAEAFF